MLFTLSAGLWADDCNLNSCADAKEIADIIEGQLQYYEAESFCEGSLSKKDIFAVAYDQLLKAHDKLSSFDATKLTYDKEKKQIILKSQEHVGINSWTGVFKLSSDLNTILSFEIFKEQTQLNGPLLKTFLSDCSFE